MYQGRRAPGACALRNRPGADSRRSAPARTASPHRSAPLRGIVASVIGLCQFSGQIQHAPIGGPTSPDVSSAKVMAAPCPARSSQATRSRRQAARVGSVSARKTRARPPRRRTLRAAFRWSRRKTSTFSTPLSARAEGWARHRARAMKDSRSGKRIRRKIERRKHSANRCLRTLGVGHLHPPFLRCATKPSTGISETRPLLTSLSRHGPPGSA